ESGIRFWAKTVSDCPESTKAIYACNNAGAVRVRISDFGNSRMLPTTARGHLFGISGITVSTRIDRTYFANRRSPALRRRSLPRHLGTRYKSIADVAARCLL
ncbi:MAG: hypothetical protein ACRD3Q_03960, partial [Terriglobales bacterium]